MLFLYPVGPGVALFLTRLLQISNSEIKDQDGSQGVLIAR